MGRLVLFLATFLAVEAIANDAALLQCRGLKDASARLACYDAISVGTQSGASAAATKPAQSDAKAAAASPGSTSKQAADRFGMEYREVLAAPSTLESHIPGRFEGWRENQRITLANGQIWQIADSSRRVLDLVNPKVTIRRGALSAFYMDFEGDNRSPRVRRLQ